MAQKPSKQHRKDKKQEPSRQLPIDKHNNDKADKKKHPPLDNHETDRKWQ